MSKASPQVDRSPSAVFITLVLDMTWRLAIVILVPVIGGYELDKALKTTPTITILGFVVAMAGMAFILWKTLQVANRQPVPKLTAAQKRAVQRQYEEDDD